MAFERHNSHTFVLGCPREDGNVAILCRTSGENPGPAYCDSKKSAVQLKTKLANDPRGMGNSRAMDIIRNLLVYKISPELEAVWDPGALWAYLPEAKLSCEESKTFW